MRHTARHITRCQTPPGRLWGEPALWKSQRRRQSAGERGRGTGKAKTACCFAGLHAAGMPAYSSSRATIASLGAAILLLVASAGSEARSVFFLVSRMEQRDGSSLRVCEGRQVCARHEKVAAAGSNAENPRDSARHVSGSAPYHCARRARARSDDGSPCQDVAPCLPRLGRASSWFVQARAGSCLAAG